MSRALSQPDQSYAEATAKVADLIAGTKVGMLTTSDGDGGFVSRPMGSVERTFDGSLWFVSRDDSRKAAQIEREPRVNVSFASSSAWVSISGHAAIVRDAAKLKELWGPGVSAWFPEGPEDPHTVLIRIDADGAEYWDTPGGPITASLLSLVKAKTSGEPYKVENDRVDL
ncbi:General stress protein 26 [Sphingomonas guangdongensis]|uniref:General stress protein 26 n=1 Tax=Sphingomonas guangdongensis TaxID=1141890 RepID=A0A285QDM2_9SPHN|nr:pyridoxamine 5'-phosphate oxidase family protein [Sphingomonas guangdongensis]SOB80050.1 General stress protein 26 [Sphingomonas guangdongensis]